METYTIEQIQRAFDKTIGAESEGGAAASRYVYEKFEAELTRKPYEFREGEVVYRTNVGYVQIHHPNVPDGRPQRLSEMPKAVEDLRNCAEFVVKHMVGVLNEKPHRELKKALADFDEVVK